MIKLKRKEVIEYISKIRPEFSEELLIKFIAELENSAINLVRVDLNGIRGIITNKVSFAMNKYKHWNCEWIYIEDHNIKMLSDE